MPATYARELEEVYREVAQGYQNIHAKDCDVASLNEFIRFLPAQASILDLGAGNGRDSRYFVSKGLDVTMVDLSKEMLRYAREQVPNAKIIVGDMTDLSFPNESFDGIWANVSLLHLTKGECFFVLRSLHRILKKKGVLFVCVKKGVGEKEVEESKYGRPMKRFIAFYEQSEMEDMLKEAGFTILTSEVVGEIITKQWVRIFSRAQHL